MYLIDNISQHLIVKRGDTLICNFTYNAIDNNEPIDLAGCSARLHVKFLRTNEIFIDASTENGLLIIELNTSTITLIVPATDMVLFPLGRYKFDLELTLPDQTVFSTDTEYLEIIQDVTI